MVWRMCWKCARGDRERCRDLVQDVSLALWLHFDNLRPDATPGEESAWVRWQTRNTLDHQMRRHRVETVALTADHAECLAAADTQRNKEDLEEMMVLLNPDEQRMMRLQLEGYQADEIANLMGLNRNTVYQRMHRAVGKMRKALLALLMIAVASSLAVAVVPQWRQAVFHIKEEEQPDEEVQSPPALPIPLADTLPEALVDSQPRRAWVPSAPLPYLVAVPDTSLPKPPATLSDPCACPDGRRLALRTHPMDTLDEDPCEPLTDTLPKVTIIVSGSNIVVEGAGDERVDVYDAQGRLVATARCSGYCMLPIRPDQVYYNNPNTGSVGTYWVQVGSRPRQRVFVKATESFVVQP